MSGNFCGPTADPPGWLPGMRSYAFCRMRQPARQRIWRGEGARIPHARPEVMPVLVVVPWRMGPALNIDGAFSNCSGNRSRARTLRQLRVTGSKCLKVLPRTYFANLAPGVGSANNMTPWSSSVCSIRASLGALVGRRSCLRSQKRTARSSTPSAAPSVR